MDKKEIEKKLFASIRDRILPIMRDQHTSYYMAFLEERGLNKGGQLFDPVDMNLYVCKRLQMDNDWLVS